MQVFASGKPVYVKYEGKEAYYVRAEGSSEPLSRLEEHEWKNRNSF